MDFVDTFQAGVLVALFYIAHQLKRTRELLSVMVARTEPVDDEDDGWSDVDQLLDGMERDRNRPKE